MNGQTKIRRAEKLSRLSPLNIEDDLLRGRFYREIQQGLSDWEEWEISLDEILMPELISFRYYGTQALKTIVVVAAGLDDMRGELAPGTTVKLPPIKWVRSRIRHYMDMERI